MKIRFRLGAQLLRFYCGYRDGPAGGGDGLLVAGCPVPVGPLLTPAGWGITAAPAVGCTRGHLGSLRNGCRLNSLELRPGHWRFKTNPGDWTVQPGETQVNRADHPACGPAHGLVSLTRVGCFGRQTGWEVQQQATSWSVAGPLGDRTQSLHHVFGLRKAGENSM